MRRSRMDDRNISEMVCDFVRDLVSFLVLLAMFCWAVLVILYRLARAGVCAARWLNNRVRGPRPVRTVPGMAVRTVQRTATPLLPSGERRAADEPLDDRKCKAVDHARLLTAQARRLTKMGAPGADRAWRRVRLAWAEAKRLGHRRE